MRNFLIIHGSDGNSEENWFPWLKFKLENLGYECIVPDFPCDDGHWLENWYGVMDEYKDKISSETVFIAHSRGVSFVLNLLMDYECKIDSLYMVGGFVEFLWGREKGDFFFREFDFNKIARLCNSFVNYQSDNDPWVPLRDGKKLSVVLPARLEVVKDAGHFNTESGYVEFPKLLDDLRKDLSLG